MRLLLAAELPLPELPELLELLLAVVGDGLRDILPELKGGGKLSALALALVGELLEDDLLDAVGCCVLADNVDRLRNALPWLSEDRAEGGVPLVLRG